MGKECPECKQDTVVKINGDGWDWDFEWCMLRGCDYDKELDTMTCVEPDGSLYVITKSEEDE